MAEQSRQHSRPPGRGRGLPEHRTAANTPHWCTWPASQAPSQDLGTEENGVAFPPSQHESVSFNKSVDSGEALRCHMTQAWASDSEKASQPLGGAARVRTSVSRCLRRVLYG